MKQMPISKQNDRLNGDMTLRRYGGLRPLADRKEAEGGKGGLSHRSLDENGT